MEDILQETMILVFPLLVKQTSAYKYNRFKKASYGKFVI